METSGIEGISSLLVRVEIALSALAGQLEKAGLADAAAQVRGYEAGPGSLRAGLESIAEVSAAERPALLRGFSIRVGDVAKVIEQLRRQHSLAYIRREKARQGAPVPQFPPPPTGVGGSLKSAAATMVDLLCIGIWSSFSRTISQLFELAFSPGSSRDPKHPHCLFCGYDLFGTVEPRCPECGQPFEQTPHTFDGVFEEASRTLSALWSVL